MAQMSKAYHAVVEKKMSICRASREYGVPESTLRDRMKERIPFNEDKLPTIGSASIFDGEEELTLAEHFNHMSYLGYGYIKNDMKIIACDYAISLNKKNPVQSHLSNCWYYEFKKRFPYVNPRKHTTNLSIERAKATSAGTVHIYYTNLKAILDTVEHEPDQLYIVDEIILPMELNAEDVYVKTNSSECARVGDSKTFTLIGCANAAGSLVPPYLILPGKRWNNFYLEGTCAGSDGECSDDGDTNAIVFNNYFNNHFRKFVPFGKDNKPIIVLYDGQKSNLMLTLKSFGEENNITFFVLPPHASCITGLNLDCFRPVPEVFNKESLLYLRKKNALSLENTEVGQLASKTYLKTMTPVTLTSAFKSIGIYPWDSSVVRTSESELGDKAMDFRGFLKKNEVSDKSGDEDECD